MQRNAKDDLQKTIDDLKKAGGIIGPIIGIILVISFAMSTFYTVEPDEEAVVIRLGKYQSTNSPGLHFKLPFGVDKVIKVQTKKVHQAEFGFRTSNVSSRVTQYSNSNFDAENDNASNRIIKIMPLLIIKLILLSIIFN